MLVPSSSSIPSGLNTPSITLAYITSSTFLSLRSRPSLNAQLGPGAPEMEVLEAVPIQSPTLVEGLASSSMFSISTVIALSVFFALLSACIIIGHLLHGNRWANESITALLLVSPSGSKCKGGNLAFAWSRFEAVNVSNLSRRVCSLEEWSCCWVKARVHIYSVSVRTCSSSICFRQSYSMPGTLFITISSNSVQKTHCEELAWRWECLSQWIFTLFICIYTSVWLVWVSAADFVKC